MGEGSEDFEPLSVSAARVIAAKGITEEAAKVVLCCAMRDKRINVQLTEIVDGKDVIRNVDVPGDLHPADIDWESSRPAPEKPWVRASAHSWWPQRLEVFGPDVTRFLTDWPADMGVLGSAQLPLTVEEEAIRELAPQLKSNPDLKHEEAENWLRDHGFDRSRLSRRRFERDVWGEARFRAGLERRAPPGPKPKRKP